MPLSVRIRFALATSIATLIVLLSACEAFSPTSNTNSAAAHPNSHT